MAVETINFWLALGTLAMQVAGVALLALYFLEVRTSDLKGPAALITTYGLWLGFVLAFGASAMTLFYSDVLGIAACVLCWWQRVFLYPQIILLGIAAFKNDPRIALYSIALSVPGALIAFYQHLLQMGVTTAAPCDAIPGTDCAARFLFEFGYITFPLMSFTLFAFLIILMLFVRPRSA